MPGHILIQGRRRHPEGTVTNRAAVRALPMQSPPLCWWNAQEGILTISVFCLGGNRGQRRTRYVLLEAILLRASDRAYPGADRAAPGSHRHLLCAHPEWPCGRLTR